MNPVRVLVVDDHALFRRGLIDLLEEDPSVSVVGEAGNGQESLAKNESLTPDVILMDVNMPVMDGVTATASLCQEENPPRILMLTVAEDTITLLRAMAAGAQGYVLKTASSNEILDAVHQVAEGWVVIAPSMGPLLMGHLRLGAGNIESLNLPPSLGKDLTPREQDVLRLIARGLTNQEIAEELVVTLDTVKSHVRAVLGKLQAGSKREVMALVQGRGAV